MTDEELAKLISSIWMNPGSNPKPYKTNQTKYKPVKKEPKVRKKPYDIIDNNPMVRRFKGYMLMDWDTGMIRTLKKPPTHLKKSGEVPIAYDITIKMPEIPLTKMKIDLELSEGQCTDIMVDAL